MIDSRELPRGYQELREKARAERAAFQDDPLPKIHIGMATCGIAAGAQHTKNSL